MACLAPLVDKPVTFKLDNKCYFGFQTICWHQEMITALNSNGHSSGIYLDLIKFSSRVLSLWGQVCFRECWSQLCTCCDLKGQGKKVNVMAEIFTHESNHFMDFVQNPRMIFHSYFNKSYAESQSYFLHQKGEEAEEGQESRSFMPKKGLEDQ